MTIEEGADEPRILWQVWFEVTCKYMDEYNHHVLEIFHETLQLRSKESEHPIKNSTPFGINSFLHEHGFHMRKDSVKTDL